MNRFVISVLALLVASGLLAADSSSYVQSGLIANWDGIEKNVAVGTYANQTVEWTDLKGGLSFLMTNAVAIAKGFDLTNAKRYGLVPKSVFDTLAAGSTDKKYTFEWVVTLGSSANSVAFCSPRTKSYYWGVRIGNNITDGRCIQVSCAYGTDVAQYPLAGDQYTTNVISVTYDGQAPVAVYVNGEAVDSASVSAAPGNGFGDFGMVGGSEVYSSNGKASRPQNGYFFAMRVYGRHLTENEIKANVMVDQERYMGIKTATCEVAATIDGEDEALDAIFVPPFGVSAVTPGTAQTFSIADAMTDYADGVRALALGEGHRVFFKDATVQDGTADPATETSESFAHQIVGNDTFVTWNFTNEQYLVETSVEGLGTVSELKKWCSVKDGTARLTAVAGQDRKFIGWSGDTDGIADPTVPTIVIPVTRARKLVATFKIQLDPHDVYPVDYTFIMDGWTGGTVPAGGSSEADELEARFRSANERCVGDFDPDQVLGLLLLVH